MEAEEPNTRRTEPIGFWRLSAIERIRISHLLVHQRHRKAIVTNFITIPDGQKRETEKELKQNIPHDVITNAKTKNKRSITRYRSGGPRWRLALPTPTRSGHIYHFLFDINMGARPYKLHFGTRYWRRITFAWCLDCMSYHADEESLDQTRLHNGAFSTMEDILGDSSNDIVHPKILVFTLRPGEWSDSIRPINQQPLWKVESKRLRLPELFFHTSMAKLPLCYLEVEWSDSRKENGRYHGPHHGPLHRLPAIELDVLLQHIFKMSITDSDRPGAEQRSLLFWFEIIHGPTALLEGRWNGKQEDLAKDRKGKAQ